VQASPEIVAKVERIKAIAQRHRVPIKAAALQFSLAHPASAAVIRGASHPERIKEDHTYAIMQAPFPVTDYLSTLRVQDTDGGKGSRVEWTGRFTPKG
jgi:D-threo-aldose 1-dehydrogenase